MPGVLDAIYVKRARLGPMDARLRASLVAGRGLKGNADQGGRRQVTIVARERWDELMANLDLSLDPASRRANLVVKGIELEDSGGRVLRVGPCRVRLIGETRPCERMEEAAPGLQDAMRERWGGGAYGEVLDDGEIAVGDEVRWDTT
ncbi:MAG TPA: MOSC domain-containing protein [Vicinamibacterales bacterium]|jgi:MOSC domain-containing protein YiiM